MLSGHRRDDDTPSHCGPLLRAVPEHRAPAGSRVEPGSGIELFRGSTRGTGLYPLVRAKASAASRGSCARPGSSTSLSASTRRSSPRRSGWTPTAFSPTASILVGSRPTGHTRRSACRNVTLLRRAWRWLSTPTAAAPRHEKWSCPCCGRDVEIASVGWTLKRRGMWLPPTEAEIVGCHGDGTTPLPRPWDHLASCGRSATMILRRRQPGKNCRRHLR